MCGKTILGAQTVRVSDLGFRRGRSENLLEMKLTADGLGV